MYKTLFKHGINYLHLNWFSRRISEPSTVLYNSPCGWSWRWSYGTSENVGKFSHGFSSMFFEMDWFFQKPLYLVRCYVSFSLWGVLPSQAPESEDPVHWLFFLATSWQVPINIFCGEEQLQQAKIWEVVGGDFLKTIKTELPHFDLKIVSLIGNCKPTQ